MPFRQDSLTLHTRRSRGAIGLLALAALTGVCALPGERAERALQLYAQRDFAGAARELTQLLEKDPTNDEACLLLGLSLQQTGELAGAERTFRVATELRPDDPRPRFFLARVIYLQGRFEAALEAAHQALARREEPARVRHLIGLIREEQGRFEEAAAAFDEAAAADQNSPEHSYRAGLALLRAQRPALALERFEAALALDPDHAPALEAKGRAEALLESLPASDALAGPQPVRLFDVAAAAGLDFAVAHHPTAEKHLPETMAGGVAAFDYDGDGWTDLFFANGAETPSLRKSGPRDWNRLYRNRGDATFVDVTATAGVQGEGFSIGASAADYDNDGDADLFVAGVRRNLLYRNDGDGTFTEVSEAAGLASDRWSVAGVWFDYDRDGSLDLFVVNYLQWDSDEAPPCRDQRTGVRTYCHPKFFEGAPNSLYRNRGDGTFEDVSAESGVAAHIGKGMGAVAADFDGDGWTDVFVTNDAVPNSLFRNRDDGRFEEIALETGAALKQDGAAVSAMGTDAADFDRDGRPDLVFTALPGETFPLFENEGEGAFRDVTYAVGLGAASYRFGGWGALFADLNNDGFVDLFTANAHVMDNVEAFADSFYRQPNLVMLNLGGLRFVDASGEAGPAFARPGAHRGAAVADFNRDGRLDVVVARLGEPVELWQNATPARNRWLGVRLLGSQSNRDGIGAEVRVGNRVETVRSARGYASSSPPVAHFGLGEQEGAVELEVRWPSGQIQRLERVKTNRLVEIVEPR